MDLTHLNPGQRAAVTAGEGPHLVVAGAGTGKTRTLVHRVAWLVEQGIAPRDIVLLTFTRRAAQEMLGRAADLAGQVAWAVRGGTFHSFAVRALRRHADKLGYSRDFTILDRGDAESLVGLVRTELGLGGQQGRRFPQRRTVLKLLSKQVNTGRTLLDLVESDYPQYLDDVDDIARIGERFRERKRQQNVLDFDDLLVRFVELLMEHEGARQRLSGEIRHLLVDEYQDTNRLQAQITALLSVVHGNVMVVGDEAQSIYGFRGADVRNILAFPELFQGASLLRLEQNYRSTQPILDLANGVLAAAEEAYDKVLFTDERTGEPPAVVEVLDENDQAAYIVERVLQLREEGVRMRDMAVLFRSGFHANVLEVELARANIPFRKFGGIQFVEAAHVKDVFALLRLVANPRDGLAWFRVLQWFDGLGAKTAEKIVAAVEAAGGRPDMTPWRKRKYGGALAYLWGVLDDAAALTDDMGALLDHLIEYYTPLLRHLYEDHRKRVRDLDTLLVLADRYDDLESFLADVALDPPSSAQVSPDDHEEEWLTLSTIHSAKGLEWHTVLVLSLGDGRFPSGHALDDPASIEEERRLFYVAVTRAKRGLELLRPRLVQSRWGGGGGPGCLLLDTIPDLDDRVRTRAWQPGEAPPEAKHPDVAAGEERLARFLAFYNKKG
jgi:DNA helicase II / ATP-dependent DNA helicase PcrA